MAYSSAITDTEDRIIKKELVIASADGQRQKTIRWEKDWLAIVDWLDNQHLAITLDSQDPEISAGRKPFDLLVLDPFSGARQILRPNFPRFFTPPRPCFRIGRVGSV
jgi:hypothetical protein